MRKTFIEQPLGYWEEESYMMVIPKNIDENIIKSCMERLVSNKEFSVCDMQVDAKGIVHLHVLYEKEDYDVGFYLGGICVPEYYLYKNFLFKDEEKEQLLNASKAIILFMKFKNDVKKSYHLQLKLAMTLIPDLIGVLDESAEKMVPAKWVKMAASSKVLPSAKDLFNVQAVKGKNKKVWLHTHGLCRCGITELEILESDEEHYGSHYNLIMTYAMFLVDNKDEDFEETKLGKYIGRLINGTPVVVTHRSWTEGLREYPKIKLGGEKDREKGHNSKTSLLFLYTSADDEANGVLSKVSFYDELWGENPIFFFSDEETNRMKSLAQERFSYVIREFKNKENTILIKVGLPLQEKGQYEHIWFELLEIKEDKFKAKLTQEPYDVKNMHTGDEAWYTKEDITDWIIYTPTLAVSPSNAYLLEE